MTASKKLSDTKVQVTVAAFVAIFSYFFYAVYVLKQVHIYEENSLLESTQVITLSIACLVFLLSLLRENRGDKLVLVFFAFLCFGFVLREVDVEHLDLPNLLAFFGHGTGRNALLATGLIVMLVYAIKHFAYYLQLARVFLRAIEGVLMIAAAALLFIGEAFEKNSQLLHHVFLEEVFELAGYVLLLVLALILSSNKLHLAQETNGSMTGASS